MAYAYEYRLGSDWPLGSARGKWLVRGLAIVLAGVGCYALATQSGSNWPAGALFAAQQFVLAILAYAATTEAYRDRTTYYVRIGLGHVTWRTFEQATLWTASPHVSLAAVQRVEVGLLHVAFVLHDGTTRRLPLGDFPYDVVRELKARFSDLDSAAGLTGGALAARRQERGLAPAVEA